jgi:hypothetical protein
MPLVFPKIEPRIAEGVLWLAGVLLVMAFLIWLWGTRKIGPGAGPHQTTHGGHSPSFGTVHGNVTIGGPSPAATQPVKSPYGSARAYDMDAITRGLRQSISAAARRPTGISGERLRAADRLPPRRPDMSLGMLAAMVSRDRVRSEMDYGDRAIFDRKINLAIMDAVTQNGVFVWARDGDRAVELIHQTELRNGILDYTKGTLRIPSLSTTFTDVKFNREQVLLYKPDFKV